MVKSEMKFYKINDQNFVFSVKDSDSDTDMIRYYHMLMGEDCTCNVRRIKNAFSFISQEICSRVEVFSSDYKKIITSLIDYCETDSKKSSTFFSGSAKKLRVMRNLSARTMSYSRSWTLFLPKAALPGI